MKYKYLFIFTIKKIIKNFDINFSLIIVLIVGLCGLMVSSELSNSIKESNTIIATIIIENSDENDKLLYDITSTIKGFDNVLEAHYDENIYVKTYGRRNIKKVANILDENNLQYKIDCKNSDGSISPKFASIIEQLSNFMFILLILATQIIFIVISIKKVNIDSEDFALLKCMGYKTKDILFIVVIQLLFAVVISFIISIILYALAVLCLSYFLHQYVSISFHSYTVLKQFIILVIEYCFVCILTALKIKGIDCLDLV